MTTVADLSLEQLDQYQVGLLDALAAGGTAAEVKARLRADPRCAALRAYVDSIDEHALEAMIVLSRRWRLERSTRW